MHPDSQLESAIKNGFKPESLYSLQPIQVKEPVWTILQQYSGIPAAKILQHVQDLRDRAFKVFPYACIGQASFLELSIASSACYPEMLERVKQGEKLLDLGCAFGQELRQLIYDGAPASNLYGSDLRPEFLELGHDLFADHNSKMHLIAADILDGDSELTAHLAGQVDITYISLFLHVFDFEQQVTVAKRVLDLLVPRPGPLIVCRVIACRDQGVFSYESARLPYYYHDRASWERLWERVQEETGITLDVNTREQEDDMAKKHPLPGIYMLGSSIRRV
ncbi:hypothetical protein BDW74DRAFT_62756 [Aspergillus multicolor]|uniref:class I SAM-dependent methyltransferase n=1 Tax=Aspergillus multicolor TaxID=41759 RepID=UPI003CCDAC55